MSQYLYRLARFAFRRRRLVLAVWLVAVIAAIALAVGSGGKTNDTFTIPGTEAQNATSVLTAKLPAFSGGQTTIVFATGNDAKVTSPADEAAINSAMTAVKKIPQVSAVVSPFQSHLVSRGGTMALGQVQWSAQPANVTTAQLDAVTAAMQPLAAHGVQVNYNGSVYPGWTFKLSEAPELVGLAIAFVILLITLGVITAAGMPIAGAVIGVVITLMGVTAVAALTTVASEATTVALMLGLSTGVDYGLFILSRHRANLLAGMTPEESAGRAVGTAGSAVVFAALTVMIALAGLTVVGVPFLTVMGLSAAGAVAISLLIALTLLPALLGFAGRRVASFTRLPLLGRRARRVARQAVTSPDTLAGARWGRFVVRHRLLMLLGGIAILGVLAIPATRLQLGLPSGSSQPAGNTQRIAYDQTTQGFGTGYNGPLLIVAQDAHGPAAPQQLAANLAKLPDVANVTPVVTQNGISVIRLIPQSGPNDQATVTLVNTIRNDRAAIEGNTGTHILVGGTTASNIDVSAKMSSALPVFLTAVVGLAFILLTFAFRTILVPLKSIAGFLLSMAAALGVQVAAFQWGWGQHLSGVPPSETTSFLPIITLAIIFGLSSDYEVFVVSRIKEDYTSHHDGRAAVHRGTGMSARVVTAAALIMFSIFVAFMTESNPTIKAFGFTFAVGVLLDAFVVRLTLVPAFMSIIGSRIWYHPQWFARHVPDPDVEGHRLDRMLEDAA